MQTRPPARALLEAVLFQTVRDAQDAKFNKDVASFINSDGFAWLWSELTEDYVGLPSLIDARSRILSGNLAIGRMAYHV